MRARLATMRYGPIFTPPSLRGSVQMPGLHGGATWSGASFDPTTGLLYVNANDMPWEVHVALSETNANQLRDALAPWLANARKIGGRRRRSNGTNGAAPVKTGSGPGSAEIRAWAQETGLNVSARGRVSSEVREAYAKAH